MTDTSAISERLFPGQFTRWTIQFEILDAFLYDAPYKKNWQLLVPDSDDEFCEWVRVDEDSELHLVENLDKKDAEIEYLSVKWKK